MTETPRTLRNFIGGEYVDSAGEQTLDLASPVTAKVVAQAPVSVQADVDAAYVAAEHGFAQWGQVTPAERQLALLKFADAIEAHADDFVQLEAQNTGKPFAITASEEVPPMVDQLRFFSGVARNLEGTSAGEYMAGQTSWIRGEPIGVVGQVTPWNYPMMMAMWKIAPFLPAGTFNVVTGDRGTGAMVVEHPTPALVASTGSVRAGMQVAEAASPGICDDFVAALAEYAKSHVKVGVPEDEDTYYGPVNNVNQLRRVTGMLDRLPDHASITSGGHRVSGLGDGYFVEPTVVSGLRQDEEMSQNEIFGPVISVQRVEDEQEAIRAAKRSAVRSGILGVDPRIRSGNAG